MSLIIGAFFTESSGTPKAGLTLTDITFYLTSRKRSDGSSTVIWDGTQTASEEVTNIGVYTRSYTAETIATHDYYIRVSYTGAETLDYDHVTGGLGDIGERVWDYTTRTLTQTAASVVASVTGSDLSIRRGDTFTATLTGLGSVASRSNLWFTLKDMNRDADSAAIVQIDENNGLLFINGKTAATTANGSITVDDEDAGDLTITIKPAETEDLLVATNLFYDIQMLTSAGVVQTLTNGTAVVVADTTRAIA